MSIIAATFRHNAPQGQSIGWASKVIALSFFALVFLAVPIATSAQANEWEWVTGPGQQNPQTHAYYPNYGPVGAFGPNYTPGGLSGNPHWVDSKGNLWVSTGTLWWEFNAATKQWAWMGGGGGNNCPSVCTVNGVYGTKGVAGTGYPGARGGSATWTDSQGRFWLFGGLGYDYTATNNGPLNDLWMLDPATNLWTWMGGDVQWTEAVYGTKGQPDSANIPGARYGAASWTDKNGNFWLYGGQGLDSTGTANTDVTILDDLWMFNSSTMQWTWVGGEDVVTSAGGKPVYGTKGVPAAANSPGARADSATWTDLNGNLWLFSGQEFNDLWEYNPTTNMWTWVTGANTYNCTSNGSGGSVCASDPVYGQLGQASALNTPGPLTGVATWTDKSGNLWLFGGGIGGVGTQDAYDDLWEFDPSTGQWAWLGGDSIQDCLDGPSDCWEPVIFGSQGVPAAGNTPGGREGALSWVDKAGNFWLLGGSVVEPAPVQEGAQIQSLSAVVAYNDVWEFTPSATTLPPAETPHLDPVPGQYFQPQAVTISGGIPTASFYYTTDGSTPTTNSTLYNGPFQLQSSETVKAIATASGYPNSGVGSAAYVLDAAQVVLSPPEGTYSSAQSVTITDSTPGATIFYTTDGSTPTTSSKQYTGPIAVSTDQTIFAIATAPNFATSPVVGASYTINVPQFTLGASPASLTLNPGDQGTVTVTLYPENGFNSTTSFACSGLPAGVTCSFSPATVTPSGAANISTTLTIAASTSAAARTPSRPWLPAGGLSLAVLLLWWRPRRTRSLWLTLLLALVGLSGLSACGGGGSQNGTGSGGGSGSTSAPIHANVTITATAGSMQQSVSVALVVM